MSPSAEMGVISSLITKLNTRGDKAAEKVIWQLVRIGKPAVLPLMRAARDESRPLVRKWSLHALGALGDPRAASLLIAALRDERMTVRLHAVKGLARMRATKAAKAVAKLLADESGGVRVNVLYALGALRAKSELAAVRRALSDPAWYVRQTAARVCGELGDNKARNKLQGLAEKDPKSAVRKAAKAALTVL